MHFVFCCEYYHPSRGGVQEVMRQIAERLVARGHRVTVATTALKERTFTSHNGVDIVEFRVSGNHVSGLRGEIEKFQDFLTTVECDAVMVKAAQQWTFDAMWPVLDRVKARKVFIPCGFSSLYEPAFAAYFSAMPGILKKFDHLIFYAERYRDIDFARQHGISSFSIIPNGASDVEFAVARDPSWRARQGIGASDFVFLVVGSPIIAKGHREVAEAFARLDTGGRHATLVLNGAWPKTDYLRYVKFPFVAARRAAQIAHREGGAALLRRSKAFLGRRGIVFAPPAQDEGAPAGVGRARLDAPDASLELPREPQDIARSRLAVKGDPIKKIICTNFSRDDVVQAFMASDLFVYASNVDYSPLVLFEAAAAGTPFLTVPVGNAEEIVAWTQAGIVCPAVRDRFGYTRTATDVLAAQMRRCMDAPDLLERLAAAGTGNWRKTYNWGAISLRYEAVLLGSAAAVATTVERNG